MHVDFVTVLVTVLSLAVCLSCRSLDVFGRTLSRKHRQQSLSPYSTSTFSKREHRLDRLLAYQHASIEECCPSVMEVIQPKGGVSKTGRILELYEDNNSTQRFYQSSCQDNVRGKPCRFIQKQYKMQSRCVQKYSYTYALVREFQSSNPWRLDHIRIRSGCTCEVQRIRKKELSTY